MTPEDRSDLSKLLNISRMRLAQEELGAEERARGNGSGAVDRDDRVVSPPTNPLGVAREFVDALYTSSGLVTLRHHGGDFYRWNGRCWPEREQRDVRAEAYGWLEKATYFNSKGLSVPFQPSRRTIDDMVDALKAATIIDSSTRPPTWLGPGGPGGPSNSPLYCPHEIVSMTNGLLHVPSRTLHPHTPNFFVHHALAFPYENHERKPDRWLAFLHEIWSDDGSSIDALQEVMGYILAGGTEQQKIFLLVGPKRAGKGTMGRVVSGLLGGHNVAAPTLSSLSTNFGLQPLIGKPLALISDARLGKKADAGLIVERLLSISGEDNLTIDRKYRDAWTGRLPTRFMLLTNELPRLSDASGALASRFVLMVMTKSFYGSENPRLTDELLEEAPAIFNWSLAGLDRLSERGYFVMSESASEAVQQLEDLGSPIGAFLRNRCELHSDSEVEVDELWKAWKEWCEEENRHPGTKGVFGRDLKAAAPTVRKGRPRRPDGQDRPYVYLGIRLRVKQWAGTRTTRTNRTDGPGGPGGPSNSPSYSPQQGWDDV